MGKFITFDDACRLPALPQQIAFDDDSAWHGARASTWANTPMARLLRPWQDLVRGRLTDPETSLDDITRRLAWYHLTTSYNSDGQWPPTLPDAPHIVHPFNYTFCFDALLAAELLVGGVDRSHLETDPARTLEEILGCQQQLILEKAWRLLDSPDPAEREAAGRAKVLIEKSRDVSSVRASGERILYPSEYRIRADVLVEARRLVGGVQIEPN